MNPNDKKFEDVLVDKVEKVKGGWQIQHSGGWCFFVEAGSPVEPLVGMLARFYGDGIGRPVRGLLLDGVEVFYRTESEEEEHSEVELYGKDAADWLARWDSGRTVFSIEMGGLGPGYEQCIHITAAEILRHLLDARYDAASWTTPPKADAEAAWKRDRDAIYEHGQTNATVKALGLSGAQWGAAVSLATSIYQRGPRAVMTDKRTKDRNIQVSKNFPQVA